MTVGCLAGERGVEVGEGDVGGDLEGFGEAGDGFA
jgi:hypothetical protein